jgi:adenylate cyclase
VEALKIKLLPAEKKAIHDRGTTNVDAYNLYLMARQYWVTGDFGNSRREQTTIRLCNRAVELDPSYAQAWALLGLAQANLRHGFSGTDNLEDGAAAANRALALDPNIPEAHLPIAWCLAEHGRHDEANAKIETALRLGPESWEVHKEAARLLYRQRRLDEAARHLEKATELMEADYHGLGMLFAYNFSKGDLEGARRAAAKVVAQVEKILAEHPENGAALAFGAPSLAVLGQTERARQWIEQALLLDTDNLQMRYNLAWGLNKVFGDTEAAIDMLAPVFANAGSNIVRLAANDPNLDNLRNEPRFIAMMEAAKKRVGLEQDSVSPAAAAATPLRS